MEHVFITGAAGFIGSNLVDRLLKENIQVSGWDNMATGKSEFLQSARQNKQFRLIQGDNLDLPSLTRAMNGCDTVFHLAANADVRFGTLHPKKDLEQNTIATFNVLEAIRSNGIKRLAFSSTGSVYGEAAVIPTSETAPFPLQTSLYGASKIACEGLISAYGEGFGLESYIFRFVSILGKRYTHGHIFDFYKQLSKDPKQLKILGDGMQRKSYLYVEDCIDAMLHVIKQQTAQKAPHKTEIYNLGTNEFVEVNHSVKIICKTLNLEPTITHTGGKRGWIGDNPFIFLDTQKIQATGWKPKLTIEMGIVETLSWIQSNTWVYDQSGS